MGHHYVVYISEPIHRDKLEHKAKQLESFFGDKARIYHLLAAAPCKVTHPTSYRQAEKVRNILANYGIFSEIREEPESYAKPAEDFHKQADMANNMIGNVFHLLEDVPVSDDPLLDSTMVPALPAHAEGRLIGLSPHASQQATQTTSHPRRWNHPVQRIARGLRALLLALLALLALLWWTNTRQQRWLNEGRIQQEMNTLQRIAQQELRDNSALTVAQLGDILRSYLDLDEALLALYSGEDSGNYHANDSKLSDIDQTLVETRVINQQVARLGETLSYSTVRIPLDEGTALSVAQRFAHPNRNGDYFLAGVFLQSAEQAQRQSFNLVMALILGSVSIATLLSHLLTKDLDASAAKPPAPPSAAPPV